MFCYFNEIWNVILVSNVICWTFLVKKFYKKPQLFITVYVIFTQTVVVWLTRPNFSHHLSLGIRWRHTKTQLTCAKSKHNLFTMWFLLCSIEEHDHHIENKMSHNNAKKLPTQKSCIDATMESCAMSAVLGCRLQETFMSTGAKYSWQFGECKRVLWSNSRDESVFR